MRSGRLLEPKPEALDDPAEGRWLAPDLDLEDPGQDETDVRYALRIGDWWFLVPTDLHTEVSPVLPCTRLPFTQDWCLGLANYRGDLVPVYDLGALMEEERGRGTGIYFLMLGPRDSRAGLRIDEMKTLRVPTSTDPIPLFPMRNFPPDFDCRGFRVEGTIFAEVDFVAVLEILAERASLLEAG